MEMDRETNAVVDGYRDPPDRVFERHSLRLEDMGQFLEHRFVGWRHDNPQQARWMSVGGLLSLPQTIEFYEYEMAVETVNKGFTTLPNNVNSRWESVATVMRRFLTRATSDIAGMDHRALRQLSAEREEYITARHGDVTDEVNRYFNRERAKSYIKSQKKKDRRVINRSIRLLSSLIGQDHTRMFISGDRIRIEGRHCVYELSKTGRMAAEHGGSGLSIFTKEDDIHLCDICVYTQGVPILDHIASIVLHVRSGDEEPILNIGNPYNVSDEARQQDWLVPYLPKPMPKDMAEHTRLFIFDDQPQIENWKEKVEDMQTDTKLFFDNMLNDYRPIMQSVAQLEW
jgi:phage pi2 protein 07